MEIVDSTTVKVEFDLEEVHEVSVDLLRFLSGDDVSESLATLGLALSLGRMMSPAVPMEPEEEVKYLTALMEWSGLYFASGTGVAN